MPVPSLATSGGGIPAFQASVHSGIKHLGMRQIEMKFPASPETMHQDEGCPVSPGFSVDESGPDWKPEPRGPLSPEEPDLRVKGWPPGFTAWPGVSTLEVCVCSGFVRIITHLLVLWLPVSLDFEPSTQLCFSHWP